MISAVGHANTRATSRVLLAEDNRELRVILAQALRREGFSVTECSDGSDLLDRLGDVLLDRGAFAYDVIVSDVRMPGVTGTEILDGIRGLPGAPPVVLITGFPDPATVMSALASGAHTVLAKPFAVREFCRVVQGVAAGTGRGSLPGEMSG